MGSGKSSTCAESRLITATGQSFLAAHPMRAEDFPLKRHTDTCRGIATYITIPFIVPTQEAYRYLPWDCYLYHNSIHCAHWRGILILAMGLLPISRFHSLCPLKRHTDTCCGNAAGSLSSPLCTPLMRQHYQLHGCPLFFTLVVTVNYSGHKPTHVHSRDNSVNCHEPLTLINYL